MIDWNKIRKHQETIKKNKERLEIEKDFKKKERIRLKNRILELKVLIEKSN